MNPLNLLKKKEKPPVCSVVIVAAGSSQRMGGDKLTMKLGAAPVLGRTILAFENSPLVDEIILVTRADRLEEIADLCHRNGMHKVRQVVSGGATRMESALAGVSAVRHGAEYIAIHDGARPLVSAELIERSTGIRTMVVDDAVSCAAYGAGKMLLHLDTLQDGMMNFYRKRQLRG